MCLVTEWSQHVNTLLKWFRQLQSLYSGVCFCFWQCLQVGYCIVQNQCPNNFLSLWFRQSHCNIFIAMFLKIFDELDSGDKFYSWNHFGVAPQIVPLKLDFTREEMEEGMHGKRVPNVFDSAGTSSLSCSSRAIIACSTWALYQPLPPTLFQVRYFTFFSNFWNCFESTLIYHFLYFIHI